MYLKPTKLVPKSNITINKAGQLDEIEGKLLELMKQRLQMFESAQSPEEQEGHIRLYRLLADEYIRIKDISPGSIVWSLVFTSVKSLDVFWNEYMSGHIKDMFEEEFIAKQLLDELCLENAELDIKVSEEDYKRCKNELTGLFELP